MADNRKDLTRQEMIRLLEELDGELTRRGERAVLYVVGGANIALAIDGSRTTTDIDVVVKRGFDIVFEAVAAVASREPGLGEDWLNAAFTGNTPDGGLTWPWLDERDSDTPTTAFKGASLHVELASPEMMLALKTLAQRPQDMDDIYKLMRMSGINTPREIGRNLHRFTGRRIFDAQGSPGMFIHIDPLFRNIFDGAPADLRPAGAGRRRSLGDRVTHRLRAWGSAARERKRARDTKAAHRQLTETALRCGIEKVTYRNGVEVARTPPCSRPDGHRGKHRFGGTS